MRSASPKKRSDYEQARETPAITAETQQAAAMPAARGLGNRANSRRRRIFRALHDCIIEQGYSKTTLADIARRAEMTPSHLLYYFQGKERILEAYFADVAQWFLHRVAEIAAQPPEMQVDLVARLWFGEGPNTYADIGFMLECFGEAVHHGEMRDTKSSFDRDCKQHLEQLFTAGELAPGIEAATAAEISYSLLIGLRNSVYFDATLSPAAAADHFRTAVTHLRRS